MRFAPLSMALVVAAVSSGGAQSSSETDAIDRAAAAMRGDDAPAAVRALRAIEGAEAAYLRGRASERALDPNAARTAYESLDLDALDWPSEVEDDVRLRRGRLLLAAGEHDAARSDLSAIERRSRPARALLAELASGTALSGGDAADAERRLRAAIADEQEDTDGFALRMLLAELLAGTGRGSDAVSTLRALLIERPEHPDDRSAWAAAERILGAPLALDLSERLARIERLSERHQHDRALSECAELGGWGESEGATAIPARGPERGEALHVIGMAHYRARRPEAHAILSEAARVGGPHEDDDAFQAARALYRTRPDADAVAALSAFVRAHPGHASATEAEYLAAQGQLDLDPARGRRALRRFATAHARGDYAREARFRLAMDGLDRRRFDDAARDLEAFASMTDDALEQLRARYWQARISEERGRASAAISAYSALVRDAPLHYYALLSRQRLLALSEPDPAPFDETASATAGTAITWPEAAAFYRRLGLDRDAAGVLRRAERRLRTAHGLQAVVDAYVEVGGYERAYRLTAGSGLLDAPWTEETAWAWRAAYPRAFERAVLDAATESHIEPALIWAVMRQESAYDPAVVSVSDAIGLMQMLPTTGARVAEGLSFPAPGVRLPRELLFTARINIRLGARYLSTLVDLVGVPAAFAAYNAGEHRVAEWWAAPACRGEWPMDRFVDWIPFGQTRNYVRRVTSHYLRYRYLEDPSRGWPDVTLAANAGDGRACERDATSALDEAATE